MVNSGDYADTADAGDGNGRQSVTEYAKYAANSRGWDLADSDGYGTPSPEAVEWLKRVQRELGRRNGDGQAVPAIAFQHIPPQEFYDCLREVPAYTPNAVEGAREFAGLCARPRCVPTRFAAGRGDWLRRRERGRSGRVA